MSWKENRRRNRVWYRHYKQLCEEVKALVGAELFAAEELVMMFFRLYERRKLHGKKTIAASALESLKLAARDAGLNRIAFKGEEYIFDERPPSRGDMFARPGTGVGESQQDAVTIGPGMIFKMPSLRCTLCGTEENDLIITAENKLICSDSGACAYRAEKSGMSKAVPVPERSTSDALDL